MDAWRERGMGSLRQERAQMEAELFWTELTGEEIAPPVEDGPSVTAPTLPSCGCGLGADGEALRARLAATIEQTIGTTSPHADRVGPTGLFAGNFDYHSAVHAHWAITSLSRVTGDAAASARALGRLSERSLAAEWAFLQQSANAAFELPYGRAWFVLLLSELAANAGRGTRAAHALREDAERQLLGWLEGNTSAAGDEATIGQHQSWLFAFLLLVMSGPVLPGAGLRIDALYNTVVASRRAGWRARTSPRTPTLSNPGEDFLHVPAIIDTLDILRGGTPFLTAATFAPSRIATLPAGHMVGLEMTRLWPVALLARRDPAMCAFLQRCMSEWLHHPEHWEMGPATPAPSWSARFQNNSHWTPQFLWMALKLRC
jgi:hypothetical protein